MTHAYLDSVIIFSHPNETFLAYYLVINKFSSAQMNDISAHGVEIRSVVRNRAWVGSSAIIAIWIPIKERLSCRTCFSVRPIKGLVPPRVTKKEVSARRDSIKAMYVGKFLENSLGIRSRKGAHLEQMSWRTSFSRESFKIEPTCGLFQVVTWARANLILQPPKAQQLQQVLNRHQCPRVGHK